MNDVNVSRRISRCTNFSSSERSVPRREKPRGWRRSLKNPERKILKGESVASITPPVRQIGNRLCVGHNETKKNPLIFTAIVLGVIFAAFIFPKRSYGANGSEESRDHNFGTAVMMIFTSIWNAHRSPDAHYFELILASNSGSLAGSPRPWWRRHRQTDGCIGDPTDRQIQAATGLVERKFPSLSDRISFSRNLDCEGSKHCFSVTVEGDNLCVRGTSGVELASGLHWFLKEECKGMSTWDKTGGTQYSAPALVAQPPLKIVLCSGRILNIQQVRSIPISFYENVVTSSYSMAFWDWTRWEAEIDWMALHGINMPLALTGQEFIWVEVYKELGIEFEALLDFFNGPAFLAWSRMGNIQGYGGPIPYSYIQGQANLQKKIVRRMREFGMSPVFSGFSGFVPKALVQKFPSLSVTKSANWCDFPEEFCCVYLLDPQDPLFLKLGSSFVTKLREEFGRDHVGFYSMDVFNEMKPSQSDPSYLSETSTAVYSAVAAADPSAIWVMQSWLFYSDQDFWKEPQIKAVLSGTPRGKMLLLDLYAERFPLWKSTEAFYGHPFIWCNLHNFGGNTDMHGAMAEISEGIFDALRARANVVGMGMCPEGIEQNPVVYELSSEMPFLSRAPNLNNWFRNYATQRYGGESESAEKAWKYLAGSVYQNTRHRPETVMDITTSRPGLDRLEAFWGLKPQVWYNPNKVILAWEELLKDKNSLNGLSSYRYDLVDVGRQVMSKLATKYWKLVEISYTARDVHSLQTNGERLLELLVDIDKMLSTHEGFLLGPWLKEARNWGSNEEEKRLLERNLKRQITIWGQSSSGDTELSDYANRQWSGSVRTFYKERWRLWLERCVTDLETGRDYDSKSFVQDIVKFTQDWIEAENSDFLSEPVGDVVSLSTEFFSKYRDEAWVLEMSI